MKSEFFTSLALVAALCFVGALFLVQHNRPRYVPGAPDGCVVCHSQVTDPSPAHPVSIVGCASCHLGNPHAMTAGRAHAGMVLNPGDLRYAELTCGRKDCHPDLPGRVKKSLMATNKGILNTLYFHWETNGEEAASPVDAPAMLAANIEGTKPRPTLAQDQFAKMCAGCHLWKPRGATQAEADLRGGGCSGCHVVSDTRGKDPELRNLPHGVITTQIPSANCVRCHSRSARSGLSYQGVYESAGYGTPLENGQPGSRRLSGERFFINLPPDAHHTSGMACIDCHTHLEVMGDGEVHEYQEQQTDVRCETCHEPVFEFLRETGPETAATARLLRSNPNIEPPGKSEMIAYSPKGAALYNVRRTDRGAFLLRKLDGEPLALKIPENKKPHHSFKGHERLSCQACHSPYMPQCYGCHLEYRLDQQQRDTLSGAVTPGRWREGRGHMRYQTPTLGLDGESIVPFAPSPAMVSTFGQNGEYLPERSPKTMAMTTFDPHSTQLASRSCADCHSNPKTLGLGAGQLRVLNGELRFTPYYAMSSPAYGVGYAADSFVSANGTQLQATSRHRRRPFNAEELQAIVRAAACVNCHNTYDDPIYTDFEANLKKLQSGRAPDCAMGGDM